MKKKKIDVGAGLYLKLPLAVGTLQWGTTIVDHKLINAKGCISETEARAIYREFRAAGVTLFDTAEGYGGGTSEKRLGRCASDERDAKSAKAKAAKAKASSSSGGSWDGAGDDHEMDDDDAPLLMTKFLPTFWRYSHACFESAVRESNRRMNIDRCPIYLLHTPVHCWRPLEFWVESASICRRKGLLTSLGLSNCNSDQVRRAVNAGKKYGVPVVCNQVHYSLLDYGSEELREMETTCKELGVLIVAYSPIGQGLLTDGLTPRTFPKIRVSKMLRLEYNEVRPLRSAVRRIADSHGAGKTMAQVCLNWCVAHGTVPLVGCRSLAQARDNLGCVGWDLTEEEVKELDRLALGRSTLESPRWRRHLFVTLAGIVMFVCQGLDWFGFGVVKEAAI